MSLPKCAAVRIRFKGCSPIDVALNLGQDDGQEIKITAQASRRRRLVRCAGTQPRLALGRFIGFVLEAALRQFAGAIKNRIGDGRQMPVDALEIA